MKPRELTIIALRVLAIYVATQAFEHLASLATYLTTPPDYRNKFPLVAIAIAWLVGPAVVAIVLWVGAPFFSRLAAPNAEREGSFTPPTEALASAAFMVAGAIIFIVYLPDLVGQVISIASVPEHVDLPHGAIGWLLVNILECIFGLSLAIGSRVLSRILIRLRYAGTGASNL